MTEGYLMAGQRSELEPLQLQTRLWELRLLDGTRYLKAHMTHPRNCADPAPR